MKQCVQLILVWTKVLSSGWNEKNIVVAWVVFEEKPSITFLVIVLNIWILWLYHFWSQIILDVTYNTKNHEYCHFDILVSFDPCNDMKHFGDQVSHMSVTMEDM